MKTWEHLFSYILNPVALKIFSILCKLIFPNPCHSAETDQKVNGRKMFYFSCHRHIYGFSHIWDTHLYTYTNPGYLEYFGIWILVEIGAYSPMKVKVKVKLLSCVRLWHPMDCSLPGSSLHGILQARVLEWVAIAFSIKRVERWRIGAFELWCWKRLLRVSWTARRSNQSILKEISPGISLEGMRLKLKL